jgi:hypothetical protein
VNRPDMNAREDAVKESCERCRPTFHAWDYTETGSTACDPVS